MGKRLIFSVFGALVPASRDAGVPRASAAMFPHTREVERPRGEVPKWARRVWCFILYPVSFHAPLALPHTYAGKEQTWGGTRSEDKRGSCIGAAGKERVRERGRRPGGRSRLVKRTGYGGAWGCRGVGRMRMPALRSTCNHQKLLSVTSSSVFAFPLLLDITALTQVLGPHVP